MTSINRVSPFGVKHLLDVLLLGAGSIEGGAVKAMLLTTTTTLPDVWDTVEFLDQPGYTLAELFGLGPVYRRETLVGTSLARNGANIDFQVPSIVWAGLLASANGDPAVTHLLIYVEQAGAVNLDANGGTDLRVPLALMDFSVTPDGSTVTYVPPSNGLFSLNTNGC